MPFVAKALKDAAEANFSAEEAIKPIISYLAANLHEGTARQALELYDRLTFHRVLALVASPRSVISRIDYGRRREKAEQVLESLLSILAIPACYTRFTSTLPLTRICILLLGENPTPVVAARVLILIAMSLQTSSSFSRKFELVGGWSILRIVLPSAWDSEVHEAAFDILLGRTAEQKSAHTESVKVVCPNIAPAIFAALHHGLEAVARCPTPDVSNNVTDGEQLSRSGILIIWSTNSSCSCCRLHNRVSSGSSCRRTDQLACLKSYLPPSL